MKIGKTEKDEREETSGLTTDLNFQVVGSPRNLARMANMLKQGNVNISLILRATNAATDVEVNSIELPHQMGLGETPLPPVRSAAARMPPVKTNGKVNLCESCEAFKSCELEIRKSGVATCEGHVPAKPLPGSTTIRTGEPIVPGAEEKKPSPVIVDLSLFSIKVLDDNKGYKVSLNGTSKKSADDLIGSILTVFNSKAVVCKSAKELSDILLLYPKSENRDLLLEVLTSGKMPEAAKK
jgi:hypothetical protein